jgi:DNA adenine methylase
MARPKKYNSPAEKQAAYRQRQQFRNAKPVKPALRYYGGKWILADWIIAHFPEHRLYVEPFGGAGSVLLKKERSFSEVFNDIDSDVVNFFRVLQGRSTFQELQRLVRYTPFAREEFEHAYTPADDPVEKARRFLIRSWMGYATGTHQVTGFRTNVKEQRRSSPAGDWRKMVNHIDLVASRLQGVCIEHRPAIQVIQGHDCGSALFYLDPPYVWATREDKEYRHEMSDDHHRELAGVLRNIQGMAILSGYDSDLYHELYAGWRRVTRKAYAQGGRERQEVLWLNARAGAALDMQQSPLFLAAGD